MLNSMNYVRDDKIIRSGEVISSDPNLKDPDVKVFYHQVAGAKSYLPDGAEISFVGGQYATKNPAILEFLNAIVDRPGSMVFSRKPGSPIPQEAIDVAAEVAQPAGNSGEVGHKAPPGTAAAILAQAKQHAAEKPIPVSEVEIQAAQK